MAAHQAPPSLGFSRQEYWYRLPFPSAGDLPNPGIKPTCLVSLHWQAGSSTLALPAAAAAKSLQSCLTLCDPMACSTCLPVHHQLPEFTQTHVQWVGDAIQPCHPLSSPSPPAPNPSQGLFQWVSSSHQMAKVLEFQLQHQSFQWTPRTDLL